MRAAVAGMALAVSLKQRLPVLEGVAGVLSGKVSTQEAAREAADTVALEE